MDHIELTFSPFACWIAAVCSSRRKVVRVDKRGVTLYRLLPFRKPEFVPWAEVTAVGWTVQTGGAWRRISSLEVLRRTAGPVAARPSTTTTEQLDIYLATQVEPGFVETFRNTDTIRRDTTLSDIDPVRLATAIAHLAPGARHFGDLGGLGLDRSNLPSPRTGPFQ